MTRNHYSYLERISSHLSSFHLPVVVQKRVTELVSLLKHNPNRILSYIQQYGIPEVSGLRAVVWNCCIVRYFICTEDYSSSYWKWIAEYYPTEQHSFPDNISHPETCTNYHTKDHPLNPSPDSIWQQYFSNQQLLNRIHMDTTRTHPDWHLFRQLEPAMNRILFLFAKQHPELGYIQGMNELVAPFVYVYLWDCSVIVVREEKQREAEAYVAFDHFLSSFISPLYQNISHLQEKLVQADYWLQQWDPELWRHLHRQQIDWHMFGRRWIQLCLCREFELPELLKIWDVLLSISHHSLRWKWLIGFMVTMVIHCRQSLLSCSSFQQCISILQHYSASCAINESQIFQLIHQTQQRIEKEENISSSSSYVDNNKE